MRHALAPGIGDPPDFRLSDCATQRNLSEAGRAQARGIGERFRERGIEVGEVRSSRWCRCLETARLLGLGDVIPTPALDSFFRDRSTAERQTDATLALMRGWSGAGNLVLVTHQVNITALVGAASAPGRSSWSGPTRRGWCGWAVCAEGVTDAGNDRGGRWPPLVDLGAHRASIDAPSITSPAGRARRARSAGTSPRG
ncbi:histidine phosphatase family protein [Halomonas denitrificans]|uniref:histidine phosphatase family protein n=1 Tax=Halomonas denitrificans TaxID=370769 RepID=UPI001FE688CA|nr:histidine phosphatase family protein [Halomonas denitrificans]